jgi:hypothetical protein
VKFELSRSPIDALGEVLANLEINMTNGQEKEWNTK